MQNWAKVLIGLGVLIVVGALSYFIWTAINKDDTNPNPPPPPGGGGAPPPPPTPPPVVSLVGKVVVANKNGVIVYRADTFEIYKTAKKGEWIGTVIAEPDKYGYYTIDGSTTVMAYRTDIKA